MKIRINGVEYEVPEGVTVAALLGHIRMAGDRIAIERNLDILPRANWASTVVQPNDSFEIVHLVGGG